jgi:FKBP-type peptidyl-prolyl cis-trans isomerase
MYCSAIGRLKSNNKVFDSSVGKKPFTFKLGRGEVCEIGVSNSYS